MKTLYLSKDYAKSFMVNYHFLNQEKPLCDYDSIITIFERLQSIQYDPLNVVGNNSELVLQSRIENYKLGMLQDALYKDRLLIDGWDKQMGIYQAKDFPMFDKIRESRAEAEINTLEYRLQLNALEYIDEVLRILKEEGPKYANQISLGEALTHKWGNTKPSSAALSYLFHKGIIGIKERRNTQKRYDLIENLIGDISTKKTILDLEDYSKYLILRRIDTMGLVWNKSSVAWSGIIISNKKERTRLLKKMMEEGILQEICIEGIKETFYARYNSLLIPFDTTNKVSFIAPLDNLIWDRDLIKTVFNFDYKWEVYTPVSKRKYGYYVLPILYNNSFIGRIEFELQRKDNPLIIKNVWWEQDCLITKETIKYMKEALHRFKDYLNAKEIINMDKIGIS